MINSSFAKVSVVVPCYNSKGTILRALDSVLKQETRVDEIIVVDDCSRDGTSSFVIDKYKEYVLGGLIKVVCLVKNSGPGEARNLGMHLARNQFVAFLDSDDSWHPKKIKVQYFFMLENNRCVLSGHAVKINEAYDNESLEVVRAKKIKPFQLYLKNRFSTPSVMIKKIEGLSFDSEKRFSEDYLFWMKHIPYGDIFYIDAGLGSLYKARFGEAGLSGRIFDMAIGEASNFISLCSARQISFPEAFFYAVVSISKSLVRVLKTSIEKVK